MMRYEPVAPMSRSEAEKALRSGEPALVSRALVSVVFHERDRGWAERWCVELLEHPDAEVRGVAATCLGHLARIHGNLDLESVLPALERAATDTRVQGAVEDAFDDIRVFVRREPA